jgi:hypothetical protein
MRVSRTPVKLCAASQNLSNNNIRKKQVRSIEICLVNNFAMRIYNPGRAIRLQFTVFSRNICADHPGAVLYRRG